MHIQYQDQERGSLISSRSSKSKDSRRSNKSKGKVQTTTPDVLPQQVIHKVQYGDTIEGLSLEYDVPVGKIRYRNHIEGDSIYHLKTIIIPNPKFIPLQKEKTENLLIQQFVGLMDYSEKSQKTARYYLQQNNWNIQAAIHEYRDDLQWERMNKQYIVTRPIDGPGIEMKDIKDYYHKMHQKKKNE